MSVSDWWGCWDWTTTNQLTEGAAVLCQCWLFTEPSSIRLLVAVSGIPWMGLSCNELQYQTETLPIIWSNENFIQEHFKISIGHTKGIEGKSVCPVRTYREFISFFSGLQKSQIFVQTLFLYKFVRLFGSFVLLSLFIKGIEPNIFTINYFKKWFNYGRNLRQLIPDVHFTFWHTDC